MIVDRQHLVRGVRSPYMGELALSLKPPKWARNAVRNLISSVQTTVTVPTPAGPINVDPRDPGLRERIAELLRGSRVSVTAGSPPAPTPAARARDLVESTVPGGFLTLGALAIGAGILLMRRRG